MIKVLFVIFVLSTSILATPFSEVELQIAQALKDKELLEAKIKHLKSKLSKKPPKESYITHTEFGYIKTDGNTDTETFNLEADIKKRFGKHFTKFKIDAQYAKSNDVESKNKYLLELEYDYDLTSKLAFDYIAGYKEDRFSSYDYQFYTGPGLLYKFIQKDKHKLSVDGNMLFSRDKNKEVRDYISFMSKGIYTWQMTKNIEFKQELSYRSEIKKHENHFIYSKSALSTKLSKIFSVGISYKFDYINLPATDKKHKDDTLTANLIVDY
ncbi:MAG: DUF481 domain-containing protein [Campylobacterota bacterium]|nr:DUF481 domain-containing protein [Campylobacterota bacterium]